MAITDYKITDGEITQRNVKSAPDVLSDTPADNKAVFDNLTEHFIGKYNNLIDNINTDFVDSSEFGEGLTVSDKVRWRYALTKGTSIGLNYSGNITQITTGFRTIVGDIDGLTETDFMDCYLNINGTDYECGDSYTSGNSILTSAVINEVTVDIIYDTTNGNITLEHTTNPLATTYWNVSIYRSVAEKVPRKALPSAIANDGYTELDSRVSETEVNGKWHGVTLDKNIQTYTTTYYAQSGSFSSDTDRYVWFDFPATGLGGWYMNVSASQSGQMTHVDVPPATQTPIVTNLTAETVSDSYNNIIGLKFHASGTVSSLALSVKCKHIQSSAQYITGLEDNGGDAAYVSDATMIARQVKTWDITDMVTTYDTNFAPLSETSFLAHGSTLKITICGTMQSSVSLGNTMKIFTVPSAYRPKDTQALYMDYGNHIKIYANTSGNIYLEAVGGNISAQTILATGIIFIIG